MHMSTVKLTIDGKEVACVGGATILEAARGAGIEIPTLCHHERLNPIVSCGLCVVEIDGAEAPVEACATPVAEGMVVHTRSEAILALRQQALQRLLSRHPLDCPVCDKAGDCRLQDLVFDLGVKGEDLQAPATRFAPVYATSLIRYWPDRCVMCLRCVTACREIKGVCALDVTEEDGKRQLAFIPENCVSCGECLQLCPVGALTENVSPNKARAFTVKKVPTTCTYCGCGCQLELQVLENKIVNVSGVDDFGVNRASLCVKGRFGYEFVSSEERLTKPLVKRNGEFQETSWDEALRLVARKLTQIKKDHGPDSIGGFASARCTNEDNYLFQKFMRAVIGTNNVDHCARL
jgi:predicted molibdopterin-dependent oxidoreductase YjgC